MKNLVLDPVKRVRKPFHFTKKPSQLDEDLTCLSPSLTLWHQRYLSRYLNSALISLKKFFLRMKGCRENASGVVPGVWTTGRHHAWGLMLKDRRLEDERSDIAKLFRLRFRIPYLLFCDILVPIFKEKNIFPDGHNHRVRVPLEFKILASRGALLDLCWFPYQHISWFHGLAFTSMRNTTVMMHSSICFTIWG